MFGTKGETVLAYSVIGPASTLNNLKNSLWRTEGMARATYCDQAELGNGAICRVVVGGKKCFSR